MLTPRQLSEDQIPPLGERMSLSEQGLKGWSLLGSNFVQVDPRNANETRALEALIGRCRVILVARSEVCAVYQVVS